MVKCLQVPTIDLVVSGCIEILFVDFRSQICRDSSEIVLNHVEVMS